MDWHRISFGFVLFFTFCSCVFCFSESSENATDSKRAEVKLNSAIENSVIEKNGKAEPKMRKQKFLGMISDGMFSGLGGNFNNPSNVVSGSNIDSSSNFDNQNGNGNSNFDPTLAVGATLGLVKGGILTGLTALKAIFLPPIFIGSIILFLIAGAAFFTCSVIGCGSLTSDGFSQITNFFKRNDFDPPSPWPYGYQEYYDNQVNQVSYPVYQALEEGYKKYYGSETEKNSFGAKKSSISNNN